MTLLVINNNNYNTIMSLLGGVAGLVLCLLVKVQHTRDERKRQTSNEV